MDESTGLVDAYLLLEAVQQPEADGALAAVLAALDVAREHGRTHVAVVLQAAQVVHALTRSGATDEPVPDELVARLVHDAERLAVPPVLAMALGLRALAAAGRGDTGALLQDAARAVALLDDPAWSALERWTAYLVVAAPFNTLRLWELVDELQTAALEVGPVPEMPTAAATVAVNRVLHRLERALALVEIERDAEAEQELLRVLTSADEAAALDLLPMWRRDVQAGALVARLLTGARTDALAAEIREVRGDLLAFDDTETLPALDAALRLACWRDGTDLAGVAPDAAEAATASSTSGAQTFPLWVAARVQDDGRSPAATAHRRHALAVGEQLWAARRAVLTSAGAQIAVERRRAEHDRLFRDVHTDALTGLLNRRSFDGWLGQLAGDERTGAALLLIDVDGFKAVNDRFGHGVGDEVLRRVGGLLRAGVRFGDLAMRHGGDEFAVVLSHPAPGPGAHTALDRALALRRSVVDHDWHDVAPDLAVSVTIGVAVSEPGGSHDTYLAADQALYEAKRSGLGVGAGRPRAQSVS
jgi:diguanylate cyclase (GGDEF)-like protein